MIKGKAWSRIERAWSTEKTTSGMEPPASGTGQTGVSRVGRDPGGSSRTSGHRRDNLRGVGTSFAHVDCSAQIRVECTQCRRPEHAPGGPAAVGAESLRPGLGHRTHYVETAAPAAEKTVCWQRTSARTVL